LTLGYVDGDALPFRQAHDAGTLERRGVHEDILSALIRSDKAEALIGVVPLHRAQFFDGAAVARRICRSLRSRTSRRLCDAVLASTLMISVTCGPFGPGLVRTSSVAPGGTLLWPLRSATLTCKKASPEPSASCTKPNPFSGLYHLTVARTDGPEGVSNCGPLGGANPKFRLAGS